jgi:glycosyltransferase involved in cell wall biosynthesis
MRTPHRILTFTSLFPSPARPRHGIFVQTRLQQLLREHPLDVRVIAPVPWFPLAWPVFGRYAAFAATPRRAVAGNGVPVSYPRYPMLPGIGMAWQPGALARAALADIARWRAEGWTPELIDAHYLYPDGVAAALVAERLGLPFVMTARGTDVNVIARLAGPGQRIRWAAERAHTVIAVSSRLKDALVQLGVPAARVAVLRNGVDAELFHPEDPAAARAAFDLPAPPRHVAVGVGNLVPEKGYDLAIEAIARLPGWHLVLAGDGPMKAPWVELARRLGVADRVRIVPAMPQAALRGLYSAADALVLTSTREGWPNVVLEALACGTPVVATDVGAVNEMLTPATGRVVAQRDAGAIAQALQAMVSAAPARATIRQHAAGFDWSSISTEQMDIFSRAVRAHGGADADVARPARSAPQLR